MEFRNTRQKPGESSSDHLNRLIKLVKFCGFKPSEQEAELVLNIATTTTNRRVRDRALKPGEIIF